MHNANQEFGITEKKVLVWVLIAASIAFICVLIPFAAPILWAGILAVLFNPINRRLLKKFPNRGNITALATLLLAIIIVVLPAFIILKSMVTEVTQMFERYDAGELHVSTYVDKVVAASPQIEDKLRPFNVSLEDIKEQLSKYAATIANFATKQSLAIGQNTLTFILNTGLMLYLAFFMLRDGSLILNWIKASFPLNDEREAKLFAKFSEVTRATVKGNLVVGLVQGALGGGIFWVLGVQPALLWAVIMAIASLIPAVGTALIWAPVALYFIITGDYVSGIILTLFGVLVIGMVDNILRPILVGRDTKLPDYIVLLSTLGGLGLVGIHGFVVGPIIAALFFSLWNMFVLEFNPEGAERLKINSTDED